MVWGQELPAAWVWPGWAWGVGRVWAQVRAKAQVRMWGMRVVERLRSQASRTYHKIGCPVPVWPRSWRRSVWRPVVAWERGLKRVWRVWWVRRPAAAGPGPPGPTPRRSYRRKTRQASTPRRRRSSWRPVRWGQAVPWRGRVALLPAAYLPVLRHTHRKRRLHRVAVNHNLDMQAWYSSSKVCNLQIYYRTLWPNTWPKCPVANLQIIQFLCQFARRVAKFLGALG